MSPKYKVGDIVRLSPWSDFDVHISIPMGFWRRMLDKNLKIVEVQDDSGYNLHINGKRAAGIYYKFKDISPGISYAWAEEYLNPAVSDFLLDEDFEI